MNSFLKQFTFALLLILSFSVQANAHPWGGLVIDNEGNIYFTFICPIEDDNNHYACVWKISASNKMQHILKAKSSPSDIILTRNLKREVFAAERSGRSPNYNNKLWLIDKTQNQLLIPSTSNQDQFHIQSLAINNKKEIYFSKEGSLNFRDSLSKVSTFIDERFGPIGLTAWGPNEELYFMADDDIYIYDGNQFKLLISDLKKRNPEDLPFSGANIFFDMIVDKNRNVYLAYYGNREIIRITPDGNAKSILKSEKPWSPHGIDIFEGEVYVLESTFGGGEWWKFWEEDPGIIPRVRKITSNGKVDSVYSYKK